MLHKPIEEARILKDSLIQTRGLVIMRGYLLLLLYVVHTCAYNGVSFRQVRHGSDIIELYGSKHRGRYNSFVDSLPSKTKSTNPVHESILDKVQHDYDMKSGQELRKSRERNLKIVQKTQPPSSILPPPTLKRYNLHLFFFISSFKILIFFGYL